MNQNLLHTPEGVRDIYGKEYAGKLKLEELIHGKLKSFGYQDIQTPSFEFFDVFSREIGTTPSKELYKFFDKEGNTLVLRPDFTPSMARCAAKYFMEETFPIRFCYSGNTFTNISSLQGKLCEVTQMGAELIGDGSVEADAEMIAMLIGCLKNAGLLQFQVTIGQADYFRGLCEAAGLTKETELALRENVSGKNIFGVEDILKQQHIAETERLYRGVQQPHARDSGGFRCGDGQRDGAGKPRSGRGSGNNEPAPERRGIGLRGRESKTLIEWLEC